MSLIRKFARPLLASTFVYDGLQRLRAPEGQEYLKPLVDTAATAVPQLRPLKGQEQLIGQAAAALHHAHAHALQSALDVTGLRGGEAQQAHVDLVQVHAQVVELLRGVEVVAHVPLELHAARLQRPPLDARHRLAHAAAVAVCALAFAAGCASTSEPA